MPRVLMPLGMLPSLAPGPLARGCRSRRIAERANAGIPLQERLAHRTGSCPARPAAAPTELQECYHAPTINQKSERLAVQMQARSWANGQVSVEDRLIASQTTKEAPEPVEQKPTINPNSERILQQRGPIAPLQERLAQNVKHVKSTAGPELDQCTLTPAISEGSKRMLKKGSRDGDVVSRLSAWGRQHARGDGDASLADRKYKFGPEDPPKPPPKAFRI